MMFSLPSYELQMLVDEVIDTSLRGLDDYKALQQRHAQERLALAEACQDMIDKVKSTAQNINKLDAYLMQNDKYYRREKQRYGEEGCADLSDDLLRFGDDLGSAVDALCEEYKSVAAPYGGCQRSALANGLHYLLSSSRKDDYEQLMLLKDTIDALQGGIDARVGSYGEAQLKELNERMALQKSDLVTEQAKKLRECVASWLLRGRIFKDTLLDEELHTCKTLLDACERCDEGEGHPFESAGVCIGSVGVFAPHTDNSGFEFANEALRRAFGLLVDGGSVRFPVVYGPGGLSAVWVRQEDDGAGAAKAVACAQAALFGFLGGVSSSRLRVYVGDARARGRNIEPFLGLQSRMPDVFCGGIRDTVQQVETCVHELSQAVSSCINDRLGNRYDNVFSYALDHGDPAPRVSFLLLFDAPSYMSPAALDDLSFVMERGVRCGVFTMVVGKQPTDRPGFGGLAQEALDRMVKAALVVNAVGDCLTIGRAVMDCRPVPEHATFARFEDRCLWEHELQSDRSVVPETVRRLAKASDPQTAAVLAEGLKDVGSAGHVSYGKVPQIESPFASSLVLGTAIYAGAWFGEYAGQALRNRFEMVGQNGSVALPYAVDLESSFDLLIDDASQSMSASAALVQRAMVGLMSVVPPSKVAVTVYNPRQESDVLSCFGAREFGGDRGRLQAELLGGGEVTRLDVMAPRLAALRDRIDATRAAMGKCTSLIAYNNEFPEAAKPLELLVVRDFPDGFSDIMLRDLESIVRNGSRCGIYAAITRSPQWEGLVGEDAELVGTIASACTHLECSDARWAIKPLDLAFRPFEPGSSDFLHTFFQSYTDQMERAYSAGIMFERILPETLWAGVVAKGRLSIPIGKGDQGKTISYEFGGGGPSQHGLVLGGTGGGKSTMLHALIMSALMNYTPDTLNLYLMDFKSGTEFKVYEEYHIPHIKLLALSAMQEFGESILEELVAEIEERGKKFTEAGVQNRGDYIAATGKAMPFVLVVMDEFQTLFDTRANRKVAAHCVQLFEVLTTKGRSFGVHVLAATQAPGEVKDSITKNSADQMRIRLGLKLDEGGLSYLLDGNNTSVKRARELQRGPKGTAVMTEDYVEQPCEGFRVAYCSDKVRRDLLGRLAKRFADVPCERRTFASGRSVLLLDYWCHAGLDRGACGDLRLHVGEPVKVAGPVVLVLNRMRRRNILVCGPTAHLRDQLVQSMLLSTIMHGDAETFYIDANRVLGYTASDGGLVECVERHSGGRLRVARNKWEVGECISRAYDRYAANQSGVVRAPTLLVIQDYARLELITDLLAGRRIEDDYAGPGSTCASTAPSPSLDAALSAELGFDVSDDGDNAFFQSCLNAFKVVKSCGDAMASRVVGTAEDCSAPPLDDRMLTLTQKFERLLTRGGDNGTTLCLTCPDYRTAKETLRAGDNYLDKFTDRFAFGITDDDLGWLFPDSPGVPAEGYVLYTDGITNDKSSASIQLKPYTMPSVDEMEAFLGRF